MDWRPIVVGVDASDQAVHAAEVGASVAAAAGAACHLVSAIPEAWAAATVSEIPFDIAAFNRESENAHREAVTSALKGRVPEPLVSNLITRLGRPEKVLDDCVEELGAGLLVLGGKHHSAVARWIAGSTAHFALRKIDVPVLIVGPPSRFTHIIAAVDLSYAAGPTLQLAEEFATLFDARLTAMHIVEPKPITTPFPLPFDTDDLVERATARLDAEIWPMIERSNTERVVRVGPVVRTLEQEVEERGADLVVLASHGKGWVDRILLGSTTERVVDDLPASLVVVHVSPDH